MKRALILCTAVLMLWPALYAGDVRAAAGQPAGEAIREQLERVISGPSPSIGGARIAALPLLETFYRQRQFGLAWTDGSNRSALLAAIAASPNEGLNPKDFHVDAIERLSDQLAAAPDDPSLRAGLDIVLSDALIRLAHQLFYGKLDPERLDADWNFAKPLLARDPIKAVASALEPGALRPFLSALRLEHPYYLALKAALRSYREIETTGGWPSVPEGPSLKPGMTAWRVGILRRRLAAGGYYDGTGTTNPDLYDHTLEAAVREFQDRHGLDIDGVVGAETLTELNVPVQARIDQIRANLERARWVLRSPDEDVIVVNIAGFYVRLVRDGDALWEARAIVGRPYRKTPVFTAEMSYLVLNPSWTVPPTILKQDILPKAKVDPSYLAKGSYRLVDKDGETVDPLTVDWPASTANGFPHQIIQDPGPNNSLGLVKFMFPNKHSVYLHDTPGRESFKSSNRTFSSGCIRVDRPFELVRLLLADQPEWSDSRIEATLGSGETTTIRLKHPLPVLLLYWTVDPDTSGDVRFYRDIYQRDAAVIRALDDGFES